MSNCSFNIIQHCCRLLLVRENYLTGVCPCHMHRDALSICIFSRSFQDRKSITLVNYGLFLVLGYFIHTDYLGQYDITLIKGRKRQEQEEDAKGSHNGINISSFTNKNTVAINGWGCSS